MTDTGPATPMTAPLRTASCACGQLTVTARSEPKDVYACSCTVCQQTSGSAFSYAALFSESALTVAGESKAWRRMADSGRWIERVFCPDCGVGVYFRAEAFPGFAGVAAGCFADADFARPKRLYWAAHRHRWLAPPEGIKTIETQ